MFGSPKKVLEIKNSYLFPVLSQLSGNVLEIGFGNGQNISHYPFNCNLFAVEKSERKIRKAEQKLYIKSRNINFIKGKAENLLFPDNYFDTVVVSFVLCSVDSVKDAMKEIQRILKPGGKFVMLEHCRSKNKLIGRLQDALTITATLLFGKCRPNWEPEQSIIKRNYLEEIDTLIIIKSFLFCVSGLKNI